ncbi:ABC1-domain-containing protein [Obelidium mucronatum]|nr:ABC1-domain-containing protein [Obelidium mucronatum]
MTYEYKVNFVPGNFEAVHQRVADMILETCSINSGLYIKFAQQIATFSTILPPQWSNFKKLYDQAPSISYEEVVKTIKQELGSHPNLLFDNFEETPVASASIAQVHRARLKSTGELVAVKVQKPDVGVQVEADLFTFNLVVHVLERVFDLPMTWTVETIDRHLRQELDFVHEARNAEKAAGFISEVPSLKETVHIPKVHWEFTTNRVMTTEWIDGVNFGHVETVQKTWGSDKVEKMMTVLVDLFSDQIFRSGFIHCDPHPGNILLRPNPQNPSNPQIVLLDHGLYIQSSPDFTRDYTRLWTSLFSHDLSAVEEIVTRWGINDVQLFAIGTLQKPWSQKKGINGSTVVDIMDKLPSLSDDPEVRKKDMYERQMKMKERARQYLADTDKVPRELIFIGRNLNIVRSNNKIYGSPVNRINLTCAWAVKTLKTQEASTLEPTFLSSFTYSILHPSHMLQPLRLYSTMFVVSLAFQTTRWWNAVVKWWNWVTFKCGSTKVSAGSSVGFEEVMEKAVRQGVYEHTGVLLDESAFDA